MYQVTFYGEELGDIESVVPAMTFDDGVACVVNALGTTKGLTVEADCNENAMFSLRVMRGDTTLAVVSDEPPAESADSVSGVVEACNALGDGDDSLIKALFQAK